MFKLFNGALSTIVIIATASLWVLVSNYQIYTTPVDADHYAKLYGSSQYVIAASSDAIDDSTVYTYAAIAYARGEDPTTVNFDSPPFGKYLYGLAYVLFGNPFILNILIYPSLLVLFYILSKYIIRHQWLRNVALLVFATLQLVTSHTRYALLELPLLLGSFLLLLLLFSKRKTTNTFIMIGIVFGLTASIKYPIPLMGVFVVLFAGWGFVDKKLKQYILSLFIAIGVFVAMYAVYFRHGHSLFDYIEFERYRFSWFKGKAVAQKFLIFWTLFTGRFKITWTQIYEVANTWSIVWPISFTTILLTWRRISWSREAKSIAFLSFSFLALFSMGAAASDRFFVHLVPYWILLAVNGLEGYYQYMFKKE